jgi:hypothetical protein
LLAAEARIPAMLAGTERPADVPTRRALAEWCFKHRRLTATAADLYALAFAAQPSLATDQEGDNRFPAARAAALAGCGVGGDAGTLDESRRAELRNRALGWLNAEYDVWALRHQSGKAGERTTAATVVRSWQKNEDFAGVRDEPALAKLPADERRAWQTFWVKVAALAARDPDAKLLQARAHVSRLEWEQAARSYAERIEIEPTDDADLWFEYAATLLLAGDRPGYTRACAYMLAQCQPAGAMRPYLVARTCTLAPDSTDNPTQPLHLAEGELNPRNAAFWAHTEKAALYFRTGNPDGTVSFAEYSLSADGRPGRALLNWLWLALANQKLGKIDEARRWLEKASGWLDEQGDRMPIEHTLLGPPSMGLHLHNWLEAHVLRREAEALIRPTGPRSPTGSRDVGTKQK